MIDIPYTWNLKRSDTNELSYKREGNKLSVVAAGRRDGGGVWDGQEHTAVLKMDGQ